MPADAERLTKQVIVIRRDLGMRRGKEIAQGSHATGAWLAHKIQRAPRSPDAHGDGTRIMSLISLSEAEFAWLGSGHTKIVCQVRTLDELTALHEKARDAGVKAFAITDAGHTEFHGVPTVTALAIGPDWADTIDGITGELELY